MIVVNRALFERTKINKSGIVVNIVGENNPKGFNPLF